MLHGGLQSEGLGVYGFRFQISPYSKTLDILLQSAGAWASTIASQLAAGQGDSTKQEILVRLGGGALLAWLLKASRRDQGSTEQQDAERAILALLLHGEPCVQLLSVIDQMKAQPPCVQLQISR